MTDADHWRWVSTPRWVRTSWKVTSTCQRCRYVVRMAVGLQSGSVQRRATVGWPEWYQRAVPVAAWRRLLVPSGQRWVRGVQTVAGSLRTVCREG